MKQGFIIRKVRKSYLRNYKGITKRGQGGRISSIPKEYVGKECLIIPLKIGVKSAINGKIRAMKLVDNILKGKDFLSK